MKKYAELIQSIAHPDGTVMRNLEDIDIY